MLGKSHKVYQDLNDTQKVGKSILHKPERAFIDWLVPKLPNFISSYHLTLTTILWVIGILGFGYLSQDNLVWLHAVSVMIFLQWLTDSLDGSVGRYRKEGLVKWGFFMDHMLDFFFGGSILIAYSMIAPESLGLVFDLLILSTGAFMALSFLSYAVTKELRVSYYFIGPTEFRITCIAINSAIYIFGTDGRLFNLGTLALLVGHYAVLTVLIAQTSNKLYKLDKQLLENNNKR